MQVERLHDPCEDEQARARQAALDLAHVRGRHLALAGERAQRDAASFAVLANNGPDRLGAVGG